MRTSQTASSDSDDDRQQREPDRLTLGQGRRRHEGIALAAGLLPDLFETVHDEDPIATPDDVVLGVVELLGARQIPRIQTLKDACLGFDMPLTFRGDGIQVFEGRGVIGGDAPRFFQRLGEDLPRLRHVVARLLVRGFDQEIARGGHHLQTMAIHIVVGLLEYLGLLRDPPYLIGRLPQSQQRRTGGRR